MFGHNKCCMRRTYLVKMRIAEANKKRAILAKQKPTIDTTNEPSKKSSSQEKEKLESDSNEDDFGADLE